MTKRATRAARAELQRQQEAGTHRPASACSCGTWRTPGQTHTKGDVGAVSKGAAAPQCND